MKRLLITLLTLQFAACSVGPDYVRPSAPVPAHYKEAGKNWRQARPQDTHDRGAWWKIFNNLELNALEERVNVSNQNIANAEAQYRQAAALVREARAAYFPVVSATAGGNKLNMGSDYRLVGNATWEIDLWGAVRRQVESNRAGMQASQAQVAAVRLSMQALLATNYFQLKALDKTHQVLEDSVAAYGKALKLTKDRFNSGVAAMSDVAAAETQYKLAQAQLIDNGVNRAQFEHAIAVLMGQPPSNFSLSRRLVSLQPPNIPLQLPSTLLERRPDIAQAEREMAASNALIGVAIAAYFPTLTLSGTRGYESNNLARLISEPNLFWSVGPELAATLFDGGLRGARTDAARAAYDQSVASYRQTVLSAFQNVEDNLAALRILAQEIKVQQQAVTAAQLALKLALENYKSGIIAYTDVIVAQYAAYSAEETAVTIAGRRMVAAVGLVAALGGGWSAVKGVEGG